MEKMHTNCKVVKCLQTFRLPIDAQITYFSTLNCATFFVSFYLCFISVIQCRALSIIYRSTDIKIRNSKKFVKQR